MLRHCHFGQQLTRSHSCMAQVCGLRLRAAGRLDQREEAAGDNQGLRLGSARCHPMAQLLLTIKSDHVHPAVGLAGTTDLRDCMGVDLNASKMEARFWF